MPLDLSNIILNINTLVYSKLLKINSIGVDYYCRDFDI